MLCWKVLCLSDGGKEVEVLDWCSGYGILIEKVCRKKDGKSETRLKGRVHHLAHDVRVFHYAHLRIPSWSEKKLTAMILELIFVEVK